MTSELPRDEHDFLEEGFHAFGAIAVGRCPHFAPPEPDRGHRRHRQCIETPLNYRGSGVTDATLPGCKLRPRINRPRFKSLRAHKRWRPRQALASLSHRAQRRLPSVPLFSERCSPGMVAAASAPTASAIERWGSGRLAMWSKTGSSPIPPSRGRPRRSSSQAAERPAPLVNGHAGQLLRHRPHSRSLLGAAQP
jgi:hypothetical protein